ncbi:MAG TPA: LacI family DNA-binding transcriptional regulator [Ktedonobacteraceae bacterium]|jgi:LacI family transcriptional regulator|nr:LacI family DNA-binding transcriptional regulator [Ktedonobacteraceae bacterium]
MSRKHTIEDIARIAGVSKATVSRVINHKPDVDPKTRQRILRIMEDEGFVPSITASDLAGGRRRLIGVIVPSFNISFIPTVLHGISGVVGNTLYELVLYSINDKTRGNNKGDVIDHILATNFVAGLIAILPGQSLKYVLRLHQHGFPVVIIDDEDTVPPEVPWVEVDNSEGAYQAVRHLLQLGHRRIAHIQGLLDNHGSLDRHQGYCRALEEAGIAPQPDLVLEGDFSVESGQALARNLFSLPVEQRPTAIFASGDLMAYGVLSAADEYGLRVPEDVALVGFDDLPLSAYMRPPLTTIKQPFEEMGRRGVELLLSMLETPHSPQEQDFFQPFTTLPDLQYAGDTESQQQNTPATHTKLATELIVRASCGASLAKPAKERPPRGGSLPYNDEVASRIW